MHSAYAKGTVAHRESSGKNALLYQAFCTTLLKLQYLVQEPVWIVGLAKIGDYVLAWGYLFAVEKLSLSSQEVQNRIVTRNSLLIHCMIVLN